MAMTAGQFFLYLLIIIILRESLASAASPTSEHVSEEPPSSVRVSTIPAGNTEASSESHQLHGYQTVEDLHEVEVDIEGEDDCESEMQRLVNRPKCPFSSPRIDLRSLSGSSPKLL